MAFGSDRSANFVIAAKDAATGPIGDIGKAMGRLQSSAGAAFKAIAAGAVVAATALAGLVIASIKAAVEDNLAQTRLVATLRARNLATTENLALIDKAIEKGAKLAFTDDDIRAGIETATQFTGKFGKALKILEVAQDLSIAKGISLEQATKLVGKAFAGSGNALKNYGINLQKNVRFTETKIDKDRRGNEHEIEITKTRKETIKGMEALALITEQYGGIADEVSQTVGFKFAAAQITFNEQIEALGYRFLPAVTTAMDFLATNVLPITEQLFTTLGDVIFDAGAKLTEKGGFVDSVLAVVGPIGEKLSPIIQELADNVGKLLGKVGDLVVALWDDGKGPLALAVSAIGGAFEILLGIINGVIEVITFLINLALEAIKLLDRLSAKQPGMSAGAAAAAGSTTFGLGTGVGGGAGGGGSSGYPTAPIGANIVIGTQATSSLDLYYGLQARTNTGQSIPGRD